MKKVLMIALIVGLLVLTGCSASADYRTPTTAYNQPQYVGGGCGVEGVTMNEPVEVEALEYL